MPIAGCELRRQGRRPLNRVLLALFTATLASESVFAEDPPGGVEVVGYRSSSANTPPEPIGSWRWDTGDEDWEWQSATGQPAPAEGPEAERACAAAAAEWDQNNCAQRYIAESWGNCDYPNEIFRGHHLESSYETVSFANACAAHDICYMNGSERASCDEALGDHTAQFCSTAPAYSSFASNCGELPPSGRNPPNSSVSECAQEHVRICTGHGQALQAAAITLGSARYNAWADSRACRAAASVRANYSCEF